MSERLPYEEKLAQQWNDLPLPDENMAWADMNRRLDDDDDDDGLIPIWLRGCALWGIAIVLLIGLGWWILKPQNWFEKKQSASQKEQPVVPAQHNSIDQSEQKVPAPNITIQNDSLKKSDQTITINTRKDNLTEISTGSYKSFIATTRKEKSNKSRNSNRPVKTSAKNKQRPSNEITVNDNSVVTKKQNADSSKRQLQQKIVPEIVTTNPKNNNSQIATDTTAKKTTDSLKKNKIAETTKPNETKKDSTQKNHFYYAAGLALQQQLPLAGQKLTPYNAEGRKGSIADYIPSVYFRIVRNKKWFVQAEFKYGAPQYNKEFLYSKKTDTLTSNITSKSLKKTFYHQLPVTINYYITKQWSIGAGVTWNKFVSVVSSQDIVHHNSQTGIDSVISKDQIISSKQFDSLGQKITDTNFVKSYLQGVFETQYQWKRFSLGVRYSFGLEPYIKFTLPGGTPQQQKNQAIIIFLRYELWRSKK